MKKEVMVTGDDGMKVPSKKTADAKCKERRMKMNKLRLAVMSLAVIIPVSTAPGGSWEEPIEINAPLEGWALYAKIASDDEGNAMAVFRQYVGSPPCTSCIYANRWNRDSGWEGPVRIAYPQSSACDKPRVAMDAAGNAIVIWFQPFGGDLCVMAKRYTPGDGWGATERISTMQAANEQDIAMTSGGKAVTVFLQQAGDEMYVFANRYLPSIGWQGAEMVAAGVHNLETIPDVAVDNQGNAICVFIADDELECPRVYAVLYRTGEGWGEPVALDPGFGEESYSYGAQVAFDLSGYAVCTYAVYREPEGYRAYAGIYRPDAGWDESEPIGSVNANSHAPSYGVAFDPDGRATAVFRQRVNDVSCLYINTFDPLVGWKGPEPLYAGDNDAQGAEIAIDPAGFAICVFNVMEEQGMRAYAARHIPGLGWGGIQSIDNGSDTAWSPRVTLDREGNALAVFDNHGSELSVCAARFIPERNWFVDAGNLTPPWEGTAEDPFPLIGDGLEAARFGDRILAAGGTYREMLAIPNGVALEGGYDRESWKRPSSPVETGSIIRPDDAPVGRKPIVTMEGGSILDGFIITGGFAGCPAVSCRDASAVIHRSVIARNRGDGIWCEGACRPLIFNNTIAHNHGSGVRIGNGARPEIVNCIIVKNAAGISCDPTGVNPPDVTYTDIWGNGSGDVWPGEGNLFENPCFRAEAEISFGFTLSADSPCIDAGIDIGFPFEGAAPDMGALEFRNFAIVQRTAPATSFFRDLFMSKTGFPGI
ncbi:MAG: right-handed parallel beta-helix repeat-containing protein [PVC group bacterium]